MLVLVNANHEPLKMVECGVWTKKNPPPAVRQTGGKTYRVFNEGELVGEQQPLPVSFLLTPTRGKQVYKQPGSEFSSDFLVSVVFGYIKY